MHVPNSSKGSYRLLSNPISPENELFQAQKYATIGLLSRCSSVVEQLFCKQQVAGSIPLTGSIFGISIPQRFKALSTYCLSLKIEVK